MGRRIVALCLAGGLVGGGVGGGFGAASQALAQQGGAPVTPKTQSPPEARVLSRAFTAVAKAMRPSVVRIDIEGSPTAAGRRPQRFFDFNEGPEQSPGPGRGTGSGVIIDSAGNIITNSHVVRGASKVTVTLADGRDFQARVVGRDDQTDIAVVRLEKPPQGLVAARLGDPATLEVGEWVLAIGSPLGLEQTVTVGIVSGKGKVGGHMPRLSGDKVSEYIQTDAKINPGNSGGPLVNLEAEVIGINTLINVGAGGAYGFAIPMSQARRVAEILIKEGRVRYAYLGVAMLPMRDVPPEMKEKLGRSAPDKGALVTDVVPSSPAARAGMRAGDVITQIDGHRVENSSDVVAQISTRAIGSKTTVSLVREGKPTSVAVTLGEMPGERAEEKDQPLSQGRLGVVLQSLTPEIAGMLGLEAQSKGAVITEVAPGSRAEKAGLRAYDVVVEINRKAVTSAEEATALIRDGAKGTMILKIRRGGRPQIVTVPAS